MIKEKVEIKKIPCICPKIMRKTLVILTKNRKCLNQRSQV